MDELSIILSLLLAGFCATNNCNFRDSSDGGGSLNFGVLSLLGLLARRKQQGS
nr:GlyGly-CTERM sorting domain-containing protein [uncultured Vibrio sp.]